MTLANFALVMLGVLLNAAAQLLLKAGTNAVGAFEFSARQRRADRLEARHPAVHPRRPGLLRHQRRGVDHGAVARRGQHRLPDALHRLRGQRGRRVVPVRRSGRRSCAWPASASSSSACTSSREVDGNGLQRAAPVTVQKRRHRTFPSRARPSTKRPSPAWPKCCARAGSPAGRRCKEFEAGSRRTCGGRLVRALHLGHRRAGGRAAGSRHRPRRRGDHARRFLGRERQRRDARRGAARCSSTSSRRRATSTSTSVEARHHPTARAPSCRCISPDCRWTATGSTPSPSAHRLRVIEDAAHALGASLERQAHRQLRRSGLVQLPSEQEHDHRSKAAPALLTDAD